MGTTWAQTKTPTEKWAFCCFDCARTLGYGATNRASRSFNNAKFDTRGCVTFSATLIRIPDVKKASQRLEAALAESMASLFH